jgi:ribA/ribD-fused uncharacterized protein
MQNCAVCHKEYCAQCLTNSTSNCLKCQTKFVVCPVICHACNASTIVTELNCSKCVSNSTGQTQTSYDFTDCSTSTFKQTDTQFDTQIQNVESTRHPTQQHGNSESFPVINTPVTQFYHQSGSLYPPLDPISKGASSDPMTLESPKPVQNNSKQTLFNDFNSDGKSPTIFSKDSFSDPIESPKPVQKKPVFNDFSTDVKSPFQAPNSQPKNAPPCKKGCGNPCMYDESRQAYFDFCHRSCTGPSNGKSGGQTVPLCKKHCGNPCFYDPIGKRYFDFCRKGCTGPQINNSTKPQGKTSKPSDQVIFPFDTIVVAGKYDRSFEKAIEIGLIVEFIDSSKKLSQIPDFKRILCGVGRDSDLKLLSQNGVPVIPLDQKSLSNIFNLFRSKTTTVLFYEKTAPFYQFTNFFDAPFYFDGQKWPTSEHYFQGQKFKDPKLMEEVRRLNTPREAFDFTRKYASEVREDWHESKTSKTPYKITAMRNALLMKFTQHSNLKELLLLTGNAKLFEHTENDKYWGDKKDGTGENHLGRLLIDIRDVLRSLPK